jgi:peptide/nickel transport system substrate-binding protein
VARGAALVAAIVLLLAVSGASGADAQMPKRGGTLVFTLPQPEPACLNVIVERCRQGTARIPAEAISYRVLQAPFEVGPDFTWRPRLVSSWSISPRPPFMLTYRIRPDARWSDGVPVTARDFVFTHRALMTHGSPDWRELHAKVRSVSAIDSKTVRIVLRGRLAAWPGLFGGILPSHALRGQDLASAWIDRIDNPRTGRPIGTGPFLVERWERGKQLTLVRNPRYWGREPVYLDRLVVRFDVNPDDLVERIRARELHVALGFPPSLVASVRAARLPIASAPATGWEHLELRIGTGGSPLLRSKLIRRAIAYGIDRVAIVRALRRESALGFRLLDSTVFLTHSRYYRPNWSRYRYRPAEARRLLEQAGCRRGGDGIYGCDGTRLSLRSFTHSSPGSLRPRVLQLVQAQLRQAGVEVVPTFTTPAAVFDSGGIYERGAFDVAMFAWIHLSPGPQHKAILGCGGHQNYTGYCQRLVTRDLDQAERLFVASRQALALNRADAQIARDVPYLPLFQHVSWAALAPGVRGVAVRTHDVLLGAEGWWLDR